MLRYIGTFNWYGEIYTLHTKADNEKIAFQKMTRALSKKLERRYSAVGSYFLNRENKYEVKVEG